MSSSIERERLLDDPHLLLYSVDPHRDRATFYEITSDLPPQHCAQARDQRRHRVRLSWLLDATQDLDLPERRVHFIWMTDFCGSTLLAKALHAMGGLYLYHETDLFRSLATAWRDMHRHTLDLTPATWQRLLLLALHVQAKTFDPQDTALVKEWPLSNVILPHILRAQPEARGVFLYATLEEYLIACLKSERRRELARSRVTGDLSEIAQLEALRHVDLASLTDAQAAALHWLTLAYLHQERSYWDEPQLRTLHNQVFFARPRESLLACAEQLGTPRTPEHAERVLAGPVFTQYSKDPSRPYSMQDRQEALDEAAEQLRGEIDAGLEWAQVILDEHPVPAELEVPLLR